MTLHQPPSKAIHKEPQMYDVIQSALTATAEFIAIAGITLILVHAVYTQHCKFMSEFCPPVAAPWAESKPMSRKLRESKAGKDFGVTPPAAWRGATA